MSTTTPTPTAADQLAQRLADNRVPEDWAAMIMYGVRLGLILPGHQASLSVPIVCPVWCIEEHHVCQVSIGPAGLLG